MTDIVGPAELRADLAQMIVTDLRGPASPSEQLPGVRTPVREWYLVGMLAPKGTIIDPSRSDGDDLHEENDEAGAPGPDDRPSKTVLFPSSAGMTFAVDFDCPEIVVTAAWGRYEKIPNPDPAAEGNHKSLWQRHPAGGPRRITLVEGDIVAKFPDRSQPEVIVRGRCRRADRCWLVTLFLVNEQLPTDRNIDERWIFQIELSAEAPNGAPVFVGRRSALTDSAREQDPELRHLGLL